MLKKMENNVGARTHPFLTPVEMGKLSTETDCASLDLIDLHGAGGGW